jgi:sigma54-dependent transcription regulator
VNPNPAAPAKLQSDLEVTADGRLIEKSEETQEERKRKLVEEGKFRADVQSEIKKYRENLQGNGKLLQDVSGKYESI